MIKKWIWVALSAVLPFVSGSGCAHAQEAANTEAKPLLHPLFSDNAVLQRDRPLPVWGWTEPGATVEVQFDAQKQTTRAGNDGRWTISMAPHAAGGPHSLSVSSAGGAATRKNLLFGDVWLCSGQSNMAYDLYGAKNPEAEIAAANYPGIRLLQVPNAITATPQQSFEGAGWQVCSPQTVAHFAGVGYFFGRDLHQKLKVPIGLIDSSWSGTPGQSWVSGPALSTMPDFKPAVDALEQSAKAQGDYNQQMTAWWQNDAGSRAHQEAPAFDDAAWQNIELPGPWEGKGFPNFDGVMWLRRVVEVPASGVGRDLTLHLGAIDDSDTTYWNGVLIGATDDHQKQRHYTVPGAQVKAGRSVIAVRVLDTGGDGGFSGPAPSLQSGADTVSLGGAWKARPGAGLQTLPPVPLKLDDPNAPVVLFNGKIAPLLPGEIKGILWYQGESNANNLQEATQYRTLLPLLVNDWRAHFGAKTPFTIVQLANFKAPDETPRDNPWPHTREAQLQTSQRLPNTPLVVTIDLGEEKDVHYKNKQEVGVRLAQSVLANTYGQKIESSGPTLREVKLVNGAVHLTFDHAQGLNLKGEANRVFAVAGVDKKFAWATPQIAGNIVTLRAPEVAAPIYARYAWSDNPRAALYNVAGLPASPFRTDEEQMGAAIKPTDADLMFDGFNRAFLVDGSYYKTSIKDEKPIGTWNASLEIMLAEDAYERTGSAQHKALVNELCTSWLKRTPPPWDWDGWNDDIGWFAMALVRGYRITGNPEFLKQAQYGFDMAWKRGWDTQYNGGGIWEQQPEKTPAGEKISKEALSNDSLGMVACLLYQSTGEKGYLDKANQIYDWVWHNIYDSKTGQVYTGIDREGKIDKGTAVYNHGLFVDYANTIYQITGSRTHFNDAKRTLDYVKNNLTKNGIFSNSQGYIDTWADTMARGLGNFVRDNRQWDEYGPWMTQNAGAILKNRRADTDITWNGWDEPTPTDDSLKSTKFVSAATWLQLTPATKPGDIGGSHAIVSQANNKAVEGGNGFDNGKGIVLSAPGEGQNQKWMFTPNADKSWNIVSQGSWKALDCPGGAATNDLQMVSWQPSRESQQRWMVDVQADGSTKITNQASGLVLSSSTDGSQLIQSPWNGNPRQRWNLK